MRSFGTGTRIAKPQLRKTKGTGRKKLNVISVDMGTLYVFSFLKGERRNLE